MDRASNNTKIQRRKKSAKALWRSCPARTKVGISQTRHNTQPKLLSYTHSSTLIKVRTNRAPAAIVLSRRNQSVIPRGGEEETGANP